MLVIMMLHQALKKDYTNFEKLHSVCDNIGPKLLSKIIFTGLYETFVLKITDIKKW